MGAWELERTYLSMAMPLRPSAAPGGASAELPSAARFTLAQSRLSRLIVWALARHCARGVGRSGVATGMAFEQGRGR